MLVELTPQQRDLLLRLVDEEIVDVGREIHHTRTYKDPLKEQKREIMALRDLLAAAGSMPAAESCADAAGDPRPALQ